MWVICFKVRKDNPHVTAPLVVYLQSPKMGCFCMSEALQFDTREEAEKYRAAHHVTHFEIIELPDELHVTAEEK